LEDGSMRRLGSLKELRVDVRLLAATNRNMAAEVKAGRFREDLYYRINVLSLELPPLRCRSGDMPLLIARFLGPEWQIEPAAIRALESYSWPGNIRQLINAIERAKILADRPLVRLHDLPPDVLHRSSAESRLAEVGTDKLAVGACHRRVSKSVEAVAIARDGVGAAGRLPAARRLRHAGCRGRRRRPP
jgi:DNA-binding NtrC family response regulator